MLCTRLPGGMEAVLVVEEAQQRTALGQPRVPRGNTAYSSAGWEAGGFCLSRIFSRAKRRFCRM